MYTYLGVKFLENFNITCSYPKSNFVALLYASQFLLINKFYLVTVYVLSISLSFICQMKCFLKNCIVGTIQIYWKCIINALCNALY